MFADTFKTFGIKVNFVDPDDPENFRRAINEKTKALYIAVSYTHLDVYKRQIVCITNI